jgi:hypothetical protein
MKRFFEQRNRTGFFIFPTVLLTVSVVGTIWSVSTALPLWLPALFSLGFPTAIFLFNFVNSHVSRRIDWRTLRLTGKTPWKLAKDGQGDIYLLFRIGRRYQVYNPHGERMAFSSQEAALSYRSALVMPSVSDDQKAYLGSQSFQILGGSDE